MATKRLTNAQWLRKLAHEAEGDVLLQMAIVQALGNFGDKLSEADPAKVGNALIDGQAWVDAGNRLKMLVDAQYGPERRAAAAVVDAGAKAAGVIG